jgi:ABC-type amino acid transport substrate-binding protein
MASSGRYVFDQCIPDGNIVISQVRPGQHLERPYSFRCNASPQVQAQLDNGTWLPGRIARGADGQLLDQDGNVLLSVNTWEFQANVRNSDYQPAGSRLMWALHQGYSVTFTMTEAVWRDPVLFAKILPAIQEGQGDVFLRFTGVVRART